MAAMDLDDRYVIWQLVAMKHAYEVTRFDDAFLKRAPGSLAGIWPAGAFCVLDLSKGFESPVLPDSLMNKERRLLVSPLLKNFLEKAALPNVEYWPIKIMDPTGRVLGDPYYFVHLFNSPDSLDLEASGAKRSRILPGMAEKVERLVFKSDPGRPLSRPKTFTPVTLVSWPLAESLANTGFSGFRFMGLFDYGIKGDLPPHPRRYKVDALCARLNASFQKNL
jgi:hypothetical protein